MVSMFACTLACVTAAARVLLLMAHNDLVHEGLKKTHHRNETPHMAVLTTGAATLLLPIGLIVFKQSGETIYDWMGTLATYGFIVVYALVALALPIHLKKLGKMTTGSVVLSVLAVAAMAVVLEGTLYPVPDFPKNYMPYMFLAYLACGVGWHSVSAAKKARG
jgi:amino acid transporter